MNTPRFTLFKRRGPMKMTHILGLDNLDLAEDVVQQALLQALRQWRFHGVPDNFNDGYGAHSGANLMREDLCGEAIRLAQPLMSRTDTGLPKAQALLALFYFQTAHLDTRVDG